VCLGRERTAFLVKSCILFLVLFSVILILLVECSGCMLFLKHAHVCLICEFGVVGLLVR